MMYALSNWKPFRGFSRGWQRGTNLVKESRSGRLLGILLILLCDLARTVYGAEQTSSTDLEFFEAKIRPVLVAHCYECHSAAAAERNKLKAGLALDTREGLLKGGESGP